MYKVHQGDCDKNQCQILGVGWTYTDASVVNYFSDFKKENILIKDSLNACLL